MTKALKMSFYIFFFPSALGGRIFLFIYFFCSSLARRSRVITDICAVPTELAAKSSASQRCPALLAVIPNTIGGSFRRRRGGKHSHRGQFATHPPTLLLPRLKDDKSDPCVRRAGVDTSSKRLADVLITFLLVPTVWRKQLIFESTFSDVVTR